MTAAAAAAAAAVNAVALAWQNGADQSCRAVRCVRPSSL